MEIIPAIDIRGGRCVRLTQGDYSRETVFADDPAEVAGRWQAAGARRIHVVDLDGAREGRAINAGTVRRILAEVSVPVQLGGGIRDLDTARSYLDAGIDRVILGTAAVKDQELLVDAVSRYREHVVVGVDARGGVVVTEGWVESSGVPAKDFVRSLSELGVRRIVYTDVSRDGMMAGPNIEAVRDLLAGIDALPSPVAVIASGGVSSIGHVQRLAETGVEAAIVGKALYTGDIDLAEAIAAAAS